LKEVPANSGEVAEPRLGQQSGPSGSRRSQRHRPSLPPPSQLEFQFP
jgi:hypothetical protein